MIIHNGVYVLSGQDGNHPPPNRQMVNHISYDFEKTGRDSWGGGGR